MAAASPVDERGNDPAKVQLFARFRLLVCLNCGVAFGPQFEFYVEGPPVSFQTKKKARLQMWKTTVHNAAAGFWNNRQVPTAESLQFSIAYFYDTVAAGDIDNIIKPIQDALIGLVYVDDGQISDVICRKRASSLPFVFHKISDVLLDALTLYDEFLYITVSDAPNPLILDL